MIYPIEPIAKPRMTQRDRWKKRPVVQRYNAFKDQIRLHRVTVPESGAMIIFHISMPKSWSKKKKEAHNGRPHQQQKDLDNLLKALFDAVYKNDGCIWEVSAAKIWAYEGAIEIN